MHLQEQYPRFRDENVEKNKALYERVAALAKKHKCTPGQLALSWVMHQGDNVVPIPGSLKRYQFRSLRNSVRRLRMFLHNLDCMQRHHGTVESMKFSC